MRSRLPLLLLLVLLPGPGGSATPQRASPPGVVAERPPEPVFSVIDSRQGLSHNTVFSILQDHEGFLWFGTIDGLNRFDGRGFRIFRDDPGDPTAIINSTVRDLREDAAGNLWVRTEGGLDRFDRSAEAFQHYPVEAVALGRGELDVMIVATDRALLRYRPAEDDYETIAAFPLSTGDGAASPSPQDPVWGLLRDGEGRIWVSTETGNLFGVDADGAVVRAQAPAGQLIVVSQIGPDRLWLGSTGGILEFDVAGKRFERPDVGYLADPKVPLVRDRNGDVWTGGPRLYRLPDGDFARAQRIVTGADRNAGLVWTALEDREGGIWVGTGSGALYLDPYAKPFEIFRHDPDSERSIGADAVVALAPGAAGTVWVGALDGGLALLDLATGLARRFNGGAPGAESACGNTVWAILPERRGELWFGTNRGLCVLDVDTGGIEAVAWPGGATLEVFSLAEGPGTVWAGTAGGLFAVDPATREATAVALDREAPRAPVVQGLVVDGDALWVGTHLSDLYRFDTATRRATVFRPVAAAAFRGSEGFWALQPRTDGRLWLGSHRGLFVFDPAAAAGERFRESLSDTSVYSILEDSRGGLWMGSQEGLLHRMPLAESPFELEAIRRYGVDAGLVHPEFNRRAATLLPDGRLAFGGMAGVVVLDPARMRDNPEPPPVVLPTVRRMRRDETIEIHPYGLDSIVLAHDDIGLSIDFVALTFSRPERASFAFRLDGFDPEWVHESGQRSVRYPALRPGRYRFEVRAANSDGVWNHAARSIEFIVPEPWWQTRTFRWAVALVLVIGAVFAGRQVATREWRRRVRALEMDRQIRQERERISLDLHDNVGSRVATLLAGLDLARLKAADEGPAADLPQQLDDLVQDARDTMEQLHETVWSLHRDRIPLTGLVDRIDELVHQRRRYTDRPRLELQVTGDLDRDLSASGALHLFRIVQEAVHNAVRHSGAETVTVRLEAGADTLVLEIEDDGLFREPEPDTPGLGLAGMRSRADRLGAVFEVRRDDPAGTRIRVEAAMDRE